MHLVLPCMVITIALKNRHDKKKKTDTEKIDLNYFLYFTVFVVSIKVIKPSPRRGNLCS